MFPTGVPYWAVNPVIVENNIVLPGFTTGKPLSPIFIIQGDWAVTTYGIEHVSGTYFIENNRVFENDWVSKISGKDWVKIEDLQIAIISARSLFTKTGRLSRPKLANRVCETLADYINKNYAINPVAEPEKGERKVSVRTRFKVLKRDGYKCNICGRSNDDGVKLEVDHKIPIAKNGLDNINNLWVLCFDCNRGKHSLEI